VLDVDEIALNLFSDSVLSYLYVSDSFCGHIVCPLHTGSIIVVDNDWAVSVLILEAKVRKDVCYLLESFVHSSTEPISASQELCAV